MIRKFIPLAIAATTLLAQTPAVKKAAEAPPAPKMLAGAANREPARSVVGPDTPVMTIRGICSAAELAAQADAPCATVITRRQFETVMAVVKATSRPGAAAIPLSVGEGYADLLIYGNAAEKSGVDKDPRFEQIEKMTRLRALSDMYRLHRDEEALKIPLSDVESYYKKNIDKFEELRLRHITLPRNNEKDLGDVEYRAKAAKLAAELRQRAAKGEDMDKLQREGFEALGVTAKRDTLMAAVRRGAFEQKAEEAIFALKPGQVTSVIEIPAVHLIYKLEGRRTLPLDEVKEEIKGKLYRERLEAESKALNDSVQIEYSKEYFGSVPTPKWVSAGALQNGSRTTPPSK